MTRCQIAPWTTRILKYACYLHVLRKFLNSERNPQIGLSLKSQGYINMEAEKHVKDALFGTMPSLLYWQQLS